MSEGGKSNIGRWLAFGLTLVVIGSLFLLAVRQMLPEKSLLKLPAGNWVLS